MVEKRIKYVTVIALISLLLISLSGCAQASVITPKTLEAASDSAIKLSNSKTTKTSLEENGDMISAYAYFLYEQAGGFLASDSTLCFTLAYIDEDDVQELIVCNGSGNSDLVWVYKYDSAVNDVKLIGGFGEYGSMVYYPRVNLIEDSFIEMGNESVSYYTIKDMDIVSLNFLQHDMDRGTYYINDVECNKSDYEMALCQYKASGDASILSFDNMTRYSSCCENSQTIGQAIISYMD